MTEGKKRGRPKGSCMDDARYLNKVADVMVRDHNLKKTPAIRRVVENEFPEHKWGAAERRLLRKWNASADVRLEAARERRAEGRLRGHSLQGYATLFEQMREPAGRLAELFENINRIRRLIDPPGMRAIRDVIDSPAIRALREQQNALRLALPDTKLLD